MNTVRDTADLTLADVLDEGARGRADQVAIIDGDLRLTYAQLADRTRSVARALVGSGVRPGDRILWAGANSSRLIELVVAAGRIGASVCPVNWRQSAEEIAFVLGDLAPSLVVYDPDLTVDWPALAGPGRSTVCTATDGRDEYEAWHTGVGHVELPSGANGASPVLLMYTAAFEGRPNAAMLSHRALIAHAAAIAEIRRIDSDFRFLTTGPMFHIGTTMFVWSALMRGGSVVVLPKFDAAAACAAIDEHRCTGAMLFPVMIDQLVEANRDRRHDLSSLVFAPNGTPEWDDMITPDDSPWGRSNAGYGQTEVGGMLALHGLGIGGLGTSGRATPFVAIRIVDENDEDVPVGEVGEFATRGWHVFNGYYNRSALNAYRFRNGWYHTNDLGRRESDGTISFIGPKTRMIKTGGENVYPADVEGVLRRHPAVADAAVIGLPDATWGQTVAAVVVVADGASVTDDEVAAHVREHAAAYKRPRRTFFVDEIPRSGFLVDYDALDERFGGGGYPGSRPATASLSSSGTESETTA